MGKLFVSLLVILLASGFSSQSFAVKKITFDGYYKIQAGKKHIGYVIQRYSFDEKKKLFTATYYLRTNKFAGDLTESLSATSNHRFKPVAYQFTQTAGNKIKVIDAKFTGLNMNATVGNGKTSQKINRKLRKSVFSSIFLVPLMMSKGITTDKPGYYYYALAEEDGKTYKGEAVTLKTMVQYLGHKVFKVKNSFKGNLFYFYVNQQGEYFGSNSPKDGISTQLVANPIEATKDMPFNPAHLKKIFGEIPAGKVNSLAQKK